MLSQGPLRDAIPENAALPSRLRQGDPEAWQTVAVKFRQRLRDLAAATLPAAGRFVVNLCSRRTHLSPQFCHV